MTRGIWTASAAAVLGLVLSANPASAGLIYWTDWANTDTCAGSCFTGSGTIATATSTVNVTYQNALGISFINDGVAETDFWIGTPSGTRNAATSPYTSTTVDNIPTGTDMLALNQAGIQTLTFSEAIVNPVFAFVSLNGNGYSFLNQDFEILSQTGNGNECGYWGCGTVTRVPVPVGSDIEYQLNGTGEPHGVIRFLGTFSTLSWRSQTSENWNGFTVGVLGTAVEFPPTTTTTTTTSTTGSTGGVPEPASLALLGVGLLAATLRLRRRA